MSSFLAVLVLKVPPIRAAFRAVNGVADAVAAATRAGTSLVFGYLGGGPLPFEPRVPGSEFILSFQALPLALVMTVLTTLLFYWGILSPLGEHPVRAALRRGVLRAENSAYGQSSAQCLRAA